MFLRCIKYVNFLAYHVYQWWSPMAPEVLLCDLHFKYFSGACPMSPIEHCVIAYTHRGNCVLYTLYQPKLYMYAPLLQSLDIQNHNCHRLRKL